MTSAPLKHWPTKTRLTDFHKFHNCRKIPQFLQFPQSLPLMDWYCWSNVRKVQRQKKKIGCYNSETRATRFAIALDKDEDRLWNFREIVEFPRKLWNLWNSTISAEASRLLLSFLKHMVGNQNSGPVIFFICVWKNKGAGTINRRRNTQTPIKIPNW